MIVLAPPGGATHLPRIITAKGVDRKAGVNVAIKPRNELAAAKPIGTSRGFGSALYAAFQTINLTRVFVWAGLLVALLYLLNGVVALIEQRLLRWRPRAMPG